MDKCLSVIVPVYNVEKYLEKSIQSIINQSYKNLEIILVDDGSTDESGKICDKYLAIDSRIRVLHQNNQGLSGARNSGMDIATGDYLAFVDSDDYIDADMYKNLISHLENEKADCVICGYKNVGFTDKKNCKESENMSVYQGLEVYYEAWRNVNNQKDFMKINVAWNKVWRREIFDGVKFPLGKVMEDLYVAPFLFERCKKIVVINKNYYNYVFREESIMGKPYSEKNLMEIYGRIQLLNCAIEKVPSDLSCMLYAEAVNSIINSYEKINYGIISDEKKSLNKQVDKYLIRLKEKGKQRFQLNIKEQIKVNALHILKRHYISIGKKINMYYYLQENI